MKITFPNGELREFQDGASAYEIAKSISDGLARNAIGAIVDGAKYDLSRPINGDATLRILTFEDQEGKEFFWHSSAHLMAEALQTLYPGVKFGIGPSIENGFYYDVDLPEGVKISIDDLPKIEAKMIELGKMKSIYNREVVAWETAVEYFKKIGDEYKLELLDGFKGQEITLYKHGTFTDLCRGPHLHSTENIKFVKLYAVAGAYWRGDVSRKMLTRIYGITFPKKQMLEEFIRIREEAEKRDHRKIGKELELFHFSAKVGMGLPLWLPNGTIVRSKLEEFLKRIQLKYGYEQVITPHIGQKELYITSGHYAKYGEDSFQPIKTPQEGEEFMLKPMNCPHHCEVYNAKPHSYRELPVRIAEFGTVYRYEQSGELHGLTRVRGFCQDDAHIFCRVDQIKEEFCKVIDIVLHIFKVLDFKEFTAQVSLRDPENKTKYIGSDENWDKAEREIIESAQEKGLNITIVTGEAAFYGPKLDFMVKDALGRKWQLGTIQVDYNLPERFELEYTGSDDKKYRPVMIHRAPFGSMERFMAVLIEHTAGNFPFWLAPVQAMILPIGGAQHEFAQEFCEKLLELGFRVKVDLRNEKVNRKIAESEQKKVPFALVIGQKEVEANAVALRKHGEGDKGQVAIDEILTMFTNLNNPEFGI